MKRIGILGGTFDPPHIGHLIIAEEVRQQLQLEEVWFIPTYEPPHKKEASIGADHRIHMINNAIKGNAAFRLNTIEIERHGKSYTIDTIKALQQSHKDTEFFFIIGADMVEYLANWSKIDELVEMITFVGVKRPGYQLKTTYPIIEVEVPFIEVSSTTIRKRFANKQSVKYLIPESVYMYIKEYQLYGN
ncbi:nicotinate-nucleotide adenylyltransferase [Ornithinibacillus halophilus]|uniref:Probable nicotinate-nucleotide adenylyltransferase n=1 Tax=Ornithinibacillus halophilus TaxID=930117 RepID=A0A1M5DKA8_9BACI|nr:nicotinate-nucleotide adenylyltransferase [Ornithinibacillus halophilus]SHF67331.1 nicotinate-nucleotide adenylyltransferase [Ornithinibacillus halophilus]